MWYGTFLDREDREALRAADRRKGLKHALMSKPGVTTLGAYQNKKQEVGDV